MFRLRAVLRCPLVTFLCPSRARSPVVCSTSRLTNRVCLSSTRATQLKDHGSASDGIAASNTGDAVATKRPTITAALSSSSNKSAHVSGTVLGDACDAHGTNIVEMPRVVSTPAPDLKFYINREGIKVPRETFFREGFAWSDADLALLRKFYDEEAPLSDILAAFPERTRHAVKNKLRFWSTPPC